MGDGESRQIGDARREGQGGERSEVKEKQVSVS